jgi:hypothetical protein
MGLIKEYTITIAVAVIIIIFNICFLIGQMRTPTAVIGNMILVAIFGFTSIMEQTEKKKRDRY